MPSVSKAFHGRFIGCGRQGKALKHDEPSAFFLTGTSEIYDLLCTACLHTVTSIAEGAFSKRSFAKALVWFWNCFLLDFGQNQAS
jgi:hypothetical protein